MRVSLASVILFAAPDSTGLICGIGFGTWSQRKCAKKRFIAHGAAPLEPGDGKFLFVYLGARSKQQGMVCARVCVCVWVRDGWGEIGWD